jgi:excisionase family DNA binding protein
MPTNIDSPSLSDKAQDGLLSVRDAADYLNMSEGWLYQSGIPYVKLGRSRRYRRSDLDSHVERNLSHGGSRGSK